MFLPSREDVTVSSTPPPPGRRWLRLALFLIPALAFVGLVTAAVLNKSEPPKPGDPAPTFTAPLLDGSGDLSLADLRGKPVLINFWASWCGPCKDEAPMLVKAHEEFGDRVWFLGVDVKDARSDALAFVEEYGIDFPSVRDESGRIYSDFGLTGQPETFFLDAEGTVVEHVAGPLFEDDLFVLLQGLVANDG